MAERATILELTDDHLDDAGAGRMLGERILALAPEAGYPTLVTDWRMTNLTSSRTWPRLGFRPTFYRLFRGIA
jgi:hypothetical protein